MKINYRQTCILILLSQIALKFLALPSLLYTVAKSMSIFIALILMVIDALYAIMLLGLAQKSGEKNFYEFMTACFGKVITKIILVVLMIKYALVVANIAKGLEFFVVDNLYNQFRWHSYVIPLIAVVGFMIYKGIRNIARVGEIVCWAILIGIIYITLKSYGSADPGNFLPLFPEGAKPLVVGSFKYASWFGSSTFILMLFGKIDFSNKKKIKLIAYLLVSILLVQFVYFVFYGIFQIASPTHSFALSDMSQFISNHSSIDELSWLIVSLWIVAQAVQLAIYGYCTSECLKYIFNIKNEVLPTILVMVYILALSVIGEYTIGMEQIFFSKSTSILCTVVQYIIPLIIVIGGWIYVLRNNNNSSKDIKENKNSSKLTKSNINSKPKLNQLKAVKRGEK